MAYNPIEAQGYVQQALDLSNSLDLPSKVHGLNLNDAVTQGSVVQTPTPPRRRRKKETENA